MAGPPVYLVVYDVLSLTSALILLLAILTVAFSKQLYRGKSWFNMMLCWLVYALSFGLLIGRQTGPEPSSGLCHLQSLLTYAAPPLAATGTLCFYIDFSMCSFRDPIRHRTLRQGVEWLLLLFPWAIHLAIDIEVIVISVLSKAQPVVEKVESNLYCHLRDTDIPALVNAAIVILAMVLLIPLEVWTGIRLFRSRRIHRGVDFQRLLSFYLRIVACTVVAAAAFGLCAVELADAKVDQRFPDLSFPFLSMAVALIFASQQDLLDVWLCRKPNRPTFESSSPHSTYRSSLRPLKTPINQAFDFEASIHRSLLQPA